jgi:hypothetical protein
MGLHGAPSKKTLNFDLEIFYVKHIREFKRTRNYKLNGTQQLYAYADNFNILGENIDTIQKKNIEKLL